MPGVIKVHLKYIVSSCILIIFQLMWQTIKNKHICTVGDTYNVACNIELLNADLRNNV